MKRVTALLPPEVYEMLMELAAEDERPISSYLRRLIVRAHKERKSNE